MHVYLVWKCLPLVKDVHVVSFLTSVTHMLQILLQMLERRQEVLTKAIRSCLWIYFPYTSR